MRYILIFASILMMIGIGACTEEVNPEETEIDDKYLYVSFKMDGEEKHFQSTKSFISYNMGSCCGASWTESSIRSLSNFEYNDIEADLTIGLNLEKSTVMGEDLEKLVGKQIKVASCVGTNCGTSIDFNYTVASGEDQGMEFIAKEIANSNPEYYFKFTEVKYYDTVENFGEEVKRYLVSGEFNVNINDTYESFGVRRISDGKFRLLFQESF